MSSVESLHSPKPTSPHLFTENGRETRLTPKPTQHTPKSKPLTISLLIVREQGCSSSPCSSSPLPLPRTRKNSKQSGATDLPGPKLQVNGLEGGHNFIHHLQRTNFDFQLHLFLTPDLDISQCHFLTSARDCGLCSFLIRYQQAACIRSEISYPKRVYRYQKGTTSAMSNEFLAPELREPKSV